MARLPERPSTAVRRLLLGVLRAPETAATLRPAELDLVLRVARRVRVLGRLADRLGRLGLISGLPAAAREQLESTTVVVAARLRSVRWELDRLLAALQTRPGLRVVALKGSAYLLADLPNAPGRVFADVDLLFAEDQLADAERALLEHGWRGTKLTAYDQHYYRAWTHELPPLVHEDREVEADLHHNILPRTARLKPSGARLLERTQPIERTAFHRLGDADLVLHAMTHLMYDSAIADGLRDLVDIDDLLREFAASNSGFWPALWMRATELDLSRPAYYALRYAHRLLGTPVPEAVLQRSREGAPPRLIGALMDSVVPVALFPRHPDAPSFGSAVARSLLYMRSLWIRMPVILLTRHLLYKLYVGRIRPLVGRVFRTPTSAAPNPTSAQPTD